MKRIFNCIFFVLIIFLSSCKEDELFVANDAVSIGGLQVAFDKIGEVNFNDAIVYATIDNKMNREIEECGVYYSTTPDFSLGQAVKKISEDNNGTSYSVKIDKLEDNVKYYFRFYVVHSAGMSLSEYNIDMSFSTPINYRVPDVVLSTNEIITEVKNNGKYERYVEAVVLHNGHYELTDFGIYYSANEDMVDAVKISCINESYEIIDGKIYYKAKLADYGEEGALPRDVPYYYQAYATNMEKGEGKSPVSTMKIVRAREYAEFEIKEIKVLSKTEAEITVRVLSQGYDDITEYGYYINGKKFKVGDNISNGTEFVLEFDNMTMGENNQIYIYGVNSDGETPRPETPTVFYTGIVDKYDPTIVYLELSPIEFEGKKYYFLDRNLGARNSYPTGTLLENPEEVGWVFQWGRDADGHQVWGSTVHSLEMPIASLNELENYVGKYLATKHTSYDWLNTSKETWQSLWNDSDEGGINNPCPEGYRIPTSKEYTLFFENKAQMKLLDSKLFRAASDGTKRNGDACYWASDLPNRDAGVFYKVKISTGGLMEDGSGSAGNYIRGVRVE